MTLGSLLDRLQSFTRPLTGRNASEDNEAPARTNPGSTLDVIVCAASATVRTALTSSPTTGRCADIHQTGPRVLLCADYPLA